MAKAMKIFFAIFPLFFILVCAFVRVAANGDPGAQPPLHTCTFNATQTAVHSKSGVPDESARWPGGVLVYEISPELTPRQMEVIEQAQSEISKATGNCITFRQRNSSDVSYLFIKKVTAGCNADVGRRDRMTEMRLSENCFLWAAIAHEFIHSLGFYHEHQREDRDDYVTVNFENILPEYTFAFEKVIPSETFGVPYDYDSVMHYPKDAFAKENGLVTITPKKNVTIGQFSHISYYDSLKLRRMYNCE